MRSAFLLGASSLVAAENGDILDAVENAIMGPLNEVLDEVMQATAPAEPESTLPPLTIDEQMQSDAKWHEFRARFNKKKSDGDDYQTFKKNEDRAAQLTEASKKNGGTAVYSAHKSEFGALSRQQFLTLNKLKVTPDIIASHHEKAAATTKTLALHAVETPTSYDLREKDALTPIKNQGQCGSCWAFSTIANIEVAYFMKYGKTISLSEQQLVDCDKVDHGCNGGLPEKSDEYLIQKHMGLETEAHYPYSGEDATCHHEKKAGAVWIHSIQHIPADEDQMAAALVKYGALSIGINAETMQMYDSGIAAPSEEECDPQEINHGVNLVGFGEEDGTKFWVIRNSWGAEWGEKGYYRIIRGKNACGLTSIVTTATEPDDKPDDDEDPTKLKDASKFMAITNDDDNLDAIYA